MHLKRQQASTKLPIPRKGSTFVARALSNPEMSVPTVIAMRDILKLARNSREVKKMIHGKILKLNGKEITDYKQPIYLFNVLHADKNYVLTISQTKKFTFSETSNSSRILKVIGKKLLKNNKIQLNLHDGTNLMGPEKISVGDSVSLDFSGKIKEHLPLKKSANVMIIKGKYLGKTGKVDSIEGSKISVSLDDKQVNLNKEQVIVQ